MRAMMHGSGHCCLANAHLVEEELQLLIGEVDTELLKAVVGELLKSKDIQDAWEQFEYTAKVMA